MGGTIASFGAEFKRLFQRYFGFFQGAVSSGERNEFGEAL